MTLTTHMHPVGEPPVNSREILVYLKNCSAPSLGYHWQGQWYYAATDTAIPESQIIGWADFPEWGGEPEEATS